LRLRAERLSDGSVFFPKPAQFQLGLRTQRAAAGGQASTVSVSGLVIPDPAHHGIVAGIEAGILQAPENGFPVLGARVQEGEILAYYTPLLSRREQAGRQAALAKARQELVVSNEALKLMNKQLGAQASMASTGLFKQRAETEREALVIRIDELEAGLSGQRELRAPLDGVISRADARSGAMLQPGQILFEIIDSDQLWVEAVSYEPADGLDAYQARAMTSRGEALELQFVGRGQALRDVALPLLFRVTGAHPGLRAGAAVRVELQARDKLDGLVLPRASIVRDSHGRDSVWVRSQAERFSSKAVRLRALDTTQVLVTGGLSTGEQVVTHGAWLLSQVQ
jgi:multidrug efflux pump subunit AcrA (membrane-fusion protein)